MKFILAISILCISTVSCLSKIDERIFFNNKPLIGDHVESILNSMADPRCPDDSVIYPCECTFDANDAMTLNCSNVMTDEELRSVFDQLGSLSFYKLYIGQEGFDSELISLSSGVFGAAAFENLNIAHVGSLSTIDSDVFDNMENVLRMIDIHDCNIDNFMMDFSSLLKFDILHFYRNGLKSFSLKSNTVREVLMDFNELSEDYVTFDTPNIEWLQLNHNNLTAAPDFSQNSKLIYSLMKGNEIATLKAGDYCMSSNLSLLSVSANQLTDIEVDAICVYQVPNAYSATAVYLYENKLTLLTEEVYGPIVGAVSPGELHIQSNPWECGCEMAWLFASDGLDKINNATTCANGTLLVDLNPEGYADC